MNNVMPEFNLGYKLILGKTYRLSDTAKTTEQLIETL